MEGGGGLHKASVSDCLPLAAPIGLPPLLILTLCGPERVLVVSTEPLDDLSCLTTPGLAVPGNSPSPLSLSVVVAAAYIYGTKSPPHTLEVPGGEYGGGRYGGGLRGGVRGGGTGGEVGGGYGGEVRGGYRGEVRRGGVWGGYGGDVRGGGTGGFGSSHTRRCTQRAVHTQGGAHQRRSVATAGVLLFQGPRARRYTQKAVHTQRSAHKRRSLATARVLLLKGPQVRRYTQKAVHTQGGAYKKAVCSHRKSLVI